MVQEGELTFTVGDETIEATGGQIVVVPPGLPHKFVSTGPGPAHHLDIHASGTMRQEWRDEESIGPPTGDKRNQNRRDRHAHVPGRDA